MTRATEIPTLRLSLLGAPQVFLDDDPVDGFVTNKARALLIYLVLNPRRHSRPRLAGLLWAESAEEQALRSLRVVLNNLRKLFPKHLEISRQYVAFNSQSPHWVDSHIFQAALEQKPEDWNVVEQALAHYRGDFLAGVSLDEAPEFEAWMLVERENLQRLAILSFEKLANAYMHARQYSLAERALQRVLELDPWRESTYRQLMLAMARTEHFEAALAQYEKCQQVLEENLGVAPMPETVRLYRRIQAAHQQPRRHNLPPQPNPFIGREHELSEVAKLLESEDQRLTTIVGIGGCGKTRLALEAASKLQGNFLHGVVFIPLDATSDASQLAGMFVETLADGGFIPSLQGRITPEAHLLEQLHNREILLILDNFEHLMDGLDLLIRMLERIPLLKLLVTSRQRLGLRWEKAISLSGLSFPNSWDDPTWDTNSSVQLFLQSAWEVAPDFPVTEEGQQAITEICQYVEGLPLALELAAAWVPVQDLPSIARSITMALDTLRSSQPDSSPRQHSLRAVCEHSWTLLSPEEQIVFAQLSIFAGSFTADAAKQIADANLLILASLVDKSLVKYTGGSGGEPSRYRLHMLLRQYAGEMLSLDKDKALSIQAKHSQYYLTFLQQHEDALKGEGQRQALSAIQSEVENVLVAWSWSVQNKKTDLLGAALESLGLYFDARSRFFEGRDVFTNAIETFAGDEANLSIYGRLLGRQAWFIRRLGELETAESLAVESWQLCQQTNMLEGQAYAELTLCLTFYDLGRYGDAEEYGWLAAANYRALGEASLAAACLNALGLTFIGLSHESVIGERDDAAVLEQTRLDEGARYFQEALALVRKTGDKRGEAVALHNLGYIQYRQGRYAEAENYFCQSYTLLLDLDSHHMVAQSLNWLGTAQAYQGNITAAKESYFRAMRLALDVGSLPVVLDALYHYVINLLVPERQITLALSLLIRITAHPATDARVRFAAEKDIANLSDSEDPECLVAAKKMARSGDLETAVELLLGQKEAVVD